jgi:signal transduction histidine kinase/DNA-binding response OmpR family regulator
MNSLKLCTGLFLFLVLFIQLPIFAWGYSGGLKHFKNYPPSEYAYHHSSNWTFLQDSQGILYVGNQAGILHYDGVRWQATDVPNNTARSMAIDHKGTIFVGGNNEIGYLAPNEKRTLEYRSLLEHLDSKYSDFQFVYNTYCTKDGVYYRSKKYLFRWDYGQIKVWETDGNYDGLFVCEGTIFVHRKKTGLMRMEEDSPVPVPGGEIFKEKKLALVVPYGKEPGKLLIGTRKHGFYIYDGREFETFSTDTDEYLKLKQLIHGIRLDSSPGDLALATREGGLVIIDEHGKLKGIYDKSIGLLSDNVKSVYEDFQGNLWSATENGITKIEYSSPYTIYDDRLNLEGLGLSVLMHNNTIYAGTTLGLFRLTSERIFRQEGISGMCFCLQSIGDSLLVAANTGLFVVDNLVSSQKILDNTSYTLVQSAAVPGRVWVGTEDGLLALAPGRAEKKWSVEYRFAEITMLVRTIAEDSKGSLWLGTDTGGAIKVDFPEQGNIQNYVVTKYSDTGELPPGPIGVYRAADHMIFTSAKGVYRFNPRKKLFVPDYTFGEEFTNGSKAVFLIKEARDGSIWFHSEGRNYQALPRQDGIYEIVLLAFPGLPDKQVNCIYTGAGDGSAWLASDAGLIFYEPEKIRGDSFKLLIRQVDVNDKLVLRNFKYKENRSPGSGLHPLEIPYEQRNIQFQFAAPFFTDEAAVRYRYFLEGTDKEWPGWGVRSSRDYIGLEPGAYRFHVKAKNVFGKESNEIVFNFTILPPWYRSWWAYSLYGLMLLLLLFAGVRWRLIKLERDKRKLQQRILNATEEIQEKNQQLQKQAGALQEMAAVRSRFFANVSHEFRTPLTLIMGPLEQMISRSTDDSQRKRLDMMRRNSQRLLTLLNQLLALSGIDKGKMKLKACEQNIVPFLKGILASFQLSADHRKVTITFSSEAEEILLYFDPEKLEDVFCSLLLNVINLTPAGETIQVEITRDRFLDVSVYAAGLDIPGPQMERMFDRFYLAEESYEHRPKGYGIGLALAKELVNLHRGELAARRVENDKGGTVFIIRLPLGDEHLAPGEIVEKSLLPPHFMTPSDIPVPPPAETGDKEKKKEPEAEMEIDEKAGEKIIILLVEDNADTRDFITEALEPLYTVVEAENGREGIKKAKKLIPDLIVSDIIMPYADGFKLCKELKKDVRTSHIPIILLTAKSGEESILEGLETGADDYVTKPFNMKLLQTRIKNLIDLRRQWQLKLARRMMLQPADVSVSPIDETFINELQEEIEKNLGDPEFGVVQLAKKLFMGRTTLYRKIRAVTGESPHQFVRSYRLKRAAQLFKANFGNVGEVAVSVGFNNISYFSQCFKEKFHLLPSEYQNAEAHDSK